MSILLTYGVLQLPLDPDLFWADENQYSPVNMSVDPSLTGALIVQEDGDASRPGRPITLAPVDDTAAWMIRADLDTLNAWGAVAGARFVLSMRGVDYPVMFRHNEPPAIDAKPVVFFSDVLTSDWYLVTLKFMTV